MNPPPKEESIVVRLELIPPQVGDYGWGYTFAVGTSGGSAVGHPDAMETLKRAFRFLRKEIRLQIETVEERKKRIDADVVKKRIRALKRSKDEGKIP